VDWNAKYQEILSEQPENDAAELKKGTYPNLATQVEMSPW
jgi:hypothetical protein